MKGKIVQKKDEIFRDWQKNIAKTEAQFEQITERVEELLRHVNEVETLMNSLVSSNNVITDSISSLSATSEEITASTHDVYEVSGKNVELVESFVASMEQIMQGFERLRAYTKDEDWGFATDAINDK